MYFKKIPNKKNNNNNTCNTINSNKHNDDLSNNIIMFTNLRFSENKSSDKKSN